VRLAEAVVLGAFAVFIQRRSSIVPEVEAEKSAHSTIDNGGVAPVKGTATVDLKLFEVGLLAVPTTRDNPDASVVSAVSAAQFSIWSTGEPPRAPLPAEPSNVYVFVVTADTCQIPLMAVIPVPPEIDTISLLPYP